ncbi:hypothetical protein Enr10x_52370 [Gimesia panareensis]|uniref:Uncharacterized protein n=1 Tax=Gimesia panareensis TaxID=2527978 RepID=A0A517QE21_9PLAN|nr:hypothetical protein [Gimesia panareensis]QDT29880.1 hypothetical protein Enr10x_52370 [Gimesia panareensis]
MQIETDHKETDVEPHTPQIESESFSPDFENPGNFPRREANRIKREKLPGIWYLNPVARVRSPKDSEEFMRVVAKRQAEWFRHLTRQFKNGWREARNQESSRFQQAFEFDGIIILDGIVLPIMDWKLFRVDELRKKHTKSKTCTQVPF